MLARLSNNGLWQKSYGRSTQRVVWLVDDSIFLGDTQVEMVAITLKGFWSDCRIDVSMLLHISAASLSRS